MAPGDNAWARTCVGAPGSPSAHSTVRRALACVEPALFSAMLVDGVVVLADAVDGQRAAGERDTERSQLQPGLYHTHTHTHVITV